MTRIHPLWRSACHLGIAEVEGSAAVNQDLTQYSDVQFVIRAKLE